MSAPTPTQAAPANPKVTPAAANAGQRRLRFDALLAQLDQVPDLLPLLYKGHDFAHTDLRAAAP